MNSVTKHTALFTKGVGHMPVSLAARFLLWVAAVADLVTRLDAHHPVGSLGGDHHGSSYQQEQKASLVEHFCLKMFSQRD